LQRFDLRELLLMANKIRIFETILLEEYSLGKIRGTIHTCIGQEYLPVFLIKTLESEDVIFGGHRAHGLFLAKTENFLGLACEIMDKVGAVCNGVGGSQHLIAKNFFTNGIQGGMWPISVGASQTLGLSSISVIVAGDGSLGEGITYESINIASIFSLPTLFVIEDNGVAQSSLQENYLSGTIQDRFLAFNLPVFFADSHNLNELGESIEDAVSFVRTKRRPAALIVKSYRLSAHSKGDDNRSKDYIKKIWDKDVINKVLEEDKNFSKQSHQIYLELKKMIKELRDLSANTFKIEDFKNQNFRKTLTLSQIDYSKERRNLKSLVSKNLSHALHENDEVVIIGQDIEAKSESTELTYGGAFGVTAEVSKEFPTRVTNFPISEQGLVGFAIGRSLMGKPTICEIMFADFSTLIIDQIRQHASKIVSMYGIKVTLPLLVRIVSGGRKGYGPTHSQNYENLFLNIPNVVVAAINKFLNCDNFYSYLINLGLPCILVENKDLYLEMTTNLESSIYTLELPNNFEDPIRIYEKKIKLRNATVISYGNAAGIFVEVIESLYLETEQFLDVFILSIISPLNLQNNQDFMDSINQTKKLIIIEETWSGSGIISEVSTELEELVRNGIKINMIGGRGDIGASLFSETESLISESKIISEISRFLEEENA